MSQTGHQIVSQEGFQETPYTEAEWDIVGNPPTEQMFSPAQIEVVTLAPSRTDAVFADYGGYGSQKGKSTRWHLPEELAANHAGSPEAEAMRMERLVEEHTAAMAAVEMRSEAVGRKAATLELEKQQEIKLKEIADRMSGLLQDLQRQLDERRDEIERQAVNLAISIAAQLTHATVDYNPEYILPLIKDGLERAGGAAVQRVKVSREDLEFLGLAGSLVGVEGAGTSWDFVADDSIRSGCIIETANGEIDLQIEPAFERVKNRILRAVK